MHRVLAAAVFISAGILTSCNRTPDQKSGTPLIVAAAANVTEAFNEIRPAFVRDTGIPVVFSYGSTAQLAQQIERGGPFDLYAAADVEHVDDLITKGKLLAKSRAIYARGRLVLWSRSGGAARISTLNDLTGASVKFIAIANPATAPYGKAAVETLKSAGIWEMVRPKLVYATNINLAREYAASGNADAALTAYALVFRAGGNLVPVDPKLHSPIDQALGIVSGSEKKEAARQFRRYLIEGRGREILQRYGYDPPSK